MDNRGKLISNYVLRVCILFSLTTSHFIRGQFFQQQQQPGDITLSVALKPPLPQSAVPFLSENSIVPPPQRKQYAHNTVLFSAEQESKLPAELLNPFYKNPRTAEALAKQSWFGPGEKHVTDRETEKIPRDQIFYVLKSAGLIRRRRSVPLIMKPYYYYSV